jgi:hypothetical protein
LCTLRAEHPRNAICSGDGILCGVHRAYATGIPFGQARDAEVVRG